MDNENPDDNEVWVPESTQGHYVPVTSSTASINGGYASNQAVQAYAQSQYDAAHYHEHDVRAQFSAASAYLVAAQAEIYQPPHSSYERISPVDEYRDIGSVSDGMPTYSTIRNAAGAHLITAPTVDSSTLQQGYHVHQVVLDPEHHRVLAVQRVLSPVDCSSSTVSQSTVNLSRRHSSHNIPEQSVSPVVTSGQSFHTVHVSSMPAYSEVSTSSGPADTSLMSHRRARLVDRDSDHAVSSISSGYRGTVMMPVPHKTHRDLQHLDHVSGEPDTTQVDNDDYRDNSPTPRHYIEETSSLDGSEAVLHSTMVATPTDLRLHVSACTGDVMDSTMDSTQDSAIDATGEVAMDCAMDRTVGSSAIQEDMGPDQPSVSGIMMTEDPILDSSMSNDQGEADKENDPHAGFVRLRKSHRLAEMELDSPSWHRRQYEPKVYNPNELWCEECMMSCSGECPAHPVQHIPDKIVLSRAWSSLPPMLQIFRLGETGGTELGVFAKRVIPRLTQFGPFIGELIGSHEGLSSGSKFLLMLERSGGEVVYFDTSDENKCNWMMFIRPSQTFAEQNMVAYQYGQDIFFTVTKNIEPKQELKIWYAAHYAERIGCKVHDITPQDMEELDMQECKFQCYECTKRFRTSASLQRHLIIHEEGGQSKGEDEEFSEKSETKKKKRSQLSLKARNYLKKRGRPPKKLKDFGGETSGYQWKKKSTSIYLNKTLKKYQKRHDSEAIRRTIQSLYRKKGKDTGGNEWVCTHCDLTFDNSNLLNLHTLTHAAEDVGLDEIRKFAYNIGENGELQISEVQKYEEGGNIVTLEACNLACPVCHMQFTSKRDLIDHAAEHGKAKKKILNPDRPYKCEKCWKAFSTQDRLQRHMLCHGDEDAKPLQCEICFKRFMNNSALSCHLKTHSDKKYYQCPICHMGFDQTMAMKDHVISHSENGVYSCPECLKQFDEFLQLRKHLRGFHSDKQYPCPECNKIFPRPDKLKLHMLKHSSHREFMCENCGRQFKRKDKLKEHIKRMHSLEREAKNLARGDRPPHKKFIPKVSPTDYHRFIYKCHACLLGFKRRGMLVNHLAKRHPEVKPEAVPELNLPILKTQRDYYCQYCDKVYKSSSKRKAHIIKNHPGAELPLSSRKKSLIPDLPGIPNPTYSQTVGSITTMPHSCEFCHKQYASKAKLTQHQRKKHPDVVPPLPDRRKSDGKMELQVLHASPDGTIPVTDRYDHEVVHVNQHQGPQDAIQTTDLLTQAMSELTQTLQQEYRQATASEYRIHGTPTMVQIPAPGHMQGHTHSTIELSHLGQTLAHTHFAAQAGHIPVTQVQVAVSPVLSQASQGPSAPPQSLASVQTISPQTIVVSGTSGQPVPLSLTTGQPVPVSLTQNTFIPRTWPNYTYR